MRFHGMLDAFKLASLTVCLICFAFVAPAAAENPDLNVTVMTRNMYAGADFGAVAAAKDQAEFQQAVQAIIESVVQSRIPDRAALLAGEIAAVHPDLIALQEATIWKIETGSGPMVLDQLELLLASLDALGQHYKKALVHTLTDVEIPDAVTFTDRDVILVRSDVPNGQLQILGTETHLYDDLMSFPVIGGDITVYRGWMAIDVKIRGARFKFVNTHLEAPLPDVPSTQALQVAQAMQLVADLKMTTLPVILAGDFNSDAEPTHNYPPDATLSYGYIVSYGGYADAWHSLFPEDPGYTWPLMDETGNAVDPIERIDLIFSKGPIALSMARTGMNAAEDGLFASDHAGMAATLSLENHRPEKDNPSVTRTRAHNNYRVRTRAEHSIANGD